MSYTAKNTIKEKFGFANTLFSCLFFLCLWCSGSIAKNQDDEEETVKESDSKSIMITASVPPVPVGITLAKALDGFPQKINFVYQHDTKTFVTDVTPFTVDNSINNEINITLKENTGLAHENSDEKTKLYPIVLIGSSKLESEDSFAAWSEPGKQPEAIEIQLPYKNETPPPGKYSGQIILLFEEVSG